MVKTKKNATKSQKPGNLAPTSSATSMELAKAPAVVKTVVTQVDGDELMGDKALGNLVLETTHESDELEAEEDLDNGKVAHNKAVVRSVKQQVIAATKALNITFTPKEEKVALGIFPKVAFP